MNRLVVTLWLCPVPPTSLTRCIMEDSLLFMTCPNTSTTSRRTRRIDHIWACCIQSPQKCWHIMASLWEAAILPAWPAVVGKPSFDCYGSHINSSRALSLRIAGGLASNEMGAMTHGTDRATTFPMMGLSGALMGIC